MHAAHLFANGPLGATHKLASLILLALAATLVGCEEDQARIPTHPVKGKITFNGKPTPGAMIVFHPKVQPAEPAPPKPTGYVDADGNFVINTYGGNDGAPAGEYEVTIRWPKPVERDGELAPGPNVLPVRYGDPKQSKIVVQVAAGQNDVPPIVLKR